MELNKVEDINKVREVGGFLVDSLSVMAWKLLGSGETGMAADSEPVGRH